MTADADALLEADLQRARQLAERQLEQLARIAEIGMDLLDRCEPSDYAGITRSVRYTQALQSRVSTELSWLVHKQVSGILEREDLRERSTPEYRQKAKVEALVERIAEAQTDRKREVTRLVREAAERLDEENFDLDRPVDVIVAEICQGLRLDPADFLTPTAHTRPPPLAGGENHEVVERAWAASDLFRTHLQPDLSG